MSVYPLCLSILYVCLSSMSVYPLCLSILYVWPSVYPLCLSILYVWPSVYPLYLTLCLSSMSGPLPVLYVWPSVCPLCLDICLSYMSSPLPVLYVWSSVCPRCLALCLFSLSGPLPVLYVWPSVCPLCLDICLSSMSRHLPVLYVWSSVCPLYLVLCLPCMSGSLPVLYVYRSMFYDFLYLYEAPHRGYWGYPEVNERYQFLSRSSSSSFLFIISLLFIPLSYLSLFLSPCICMSHLSIILLLWKVCPWYLYKLDLIRFQSICIWRALIIAMLVIRFLPFISVSFGLCLVKYFYFVNAIIGMKS